MRFQFEELCKSGRWRTRFEAKLVRCPCQICGRPVTFGAPFCKFHLEEEFGVGIRPEPRLGQGQNGLVSMRKFHAGDFIIPYGGELINNRELRERYGDHTAPYALQLSGKYCQDAAIVRSAGAFSNHFQGLAASPNARFEKLDGAMWLRAILPIAKGDAILTDYGPEYILREPDSRYRTARPLRKLQCNF